MIIKVDTLAVLKNKGVYQIKNLFNGKIYIGSTLTSFIYRWRQHSSKLKLGKHENNHLQSSYNKYGESNFEYSVLYIGTSKDDIRSKEQELINSFDSCNHNKGYNLDFIVDRSIRSDGTKRKISLSRKGKCSGSSNGFYGKTHTEEVKEHIRQAHIGKRLSDTTKEKMSEKKKIKVKINGIIYPSIKDAAEKLGLSKATLSRWVKDERKINYEVV